MSRPFATVALACAALGSVAFAGVRIAGAKERHLGYYEKYVQPHIRVYGTNPALANATLRSLRRPPGFRDVLPCEESGPGWACWGRSPSDPLGDAAMGRLLAAMGVTPYAAYKAIYGEAVPAIRCGRLHQYRKYRLGLQTCQAEAMKGKERLAVFATSTVSPADKPTTRGVRGFPYPTEVNVFVIGHFEHEGVQPGEEEG
jgi:hypothetical protein